MSKEVITLELDAERLREAQAMASASGQPAELVLTEMLDETIKMRRCPGIIFTDGPAGRSAVIVGTGIEVWSIIDAWNGGCQQDDNKLRVTFHWLPALRYYELYPDEIDQWIERNNRAGEKLQQKYPQLVGPRT